MTTNVQSITVEVPPCCFGCNSTDWQWRVEDVRRNGGVARATFYCDPCLQKRRQAEGSETPNDVE